MRGRAGAARTLGLLKNDFGADELRHSEFVVGWKQGVTRRRAFPSYSSPALPWPPSPPPNRPWSVVRTLASNSRGQPCPNGLHRARMACSQRCQTPSVPRRSRTAKTLHRAYSCLPPVRVSVECVHRPRLCLPFSPPRAKQVTPPRSKARKASSKPAKAKAATTQEAAGNGRCTGAGCTDAARPKCYRQMCAPCCFAEGKQKYCKAHAALFRGVCEYM